MICINIHISQGGTKRRRLPVERAALDRLPAYTYLSIYLSIYIYIYIHIYDKPSQGGTERRCLSLERAALDRLPARVQPARAHLPAHLRNAAGGRVGG